jgi:hypothetical protein
MLAVVLLCLGCQNAAELVCVLARKSADPHGRGGHACWLGGQSWTGPAARGFFFLFGWAGQFPVPYCLVAMLKSVWRTLSAKWTVAPKCSDNVIHKFRNLGDMGLWQLQAGFRTLSTYSGRVQDIWLTIVYSNRH